MRVYEITDEVRFKCNYNAGKAWAAIKDGKVVAFILMNDVVYIGLDNVFETGKYKRNCAGARRMQERMQTEAFLRHRKEAKSKLAKLGEVVSGMLSGLQFYVEEK